MTKLSFCARQNQQKKEEESIVLAGLDDHEREVAETVIKAMKNGLRCELEYDGLHRMVEIHAVGLSTTGKPVMRVYQVMGDSHSGDKSSWKLMSLGKVFNIPHILDIQSAAPREGYKPGDMGMSHIYTEL